MKKQLYFKDIDDTHCIHLEDHLHDAKLEGLSEITLVKAEPDNENTDYVWCMHYGDVNERSTCRKNECGAYKSNSGRGVCQHRGHLYSHGQEETFKIDQ